MTIERLKQEIARLNDELTCESEAHEAVASANRRMKTALVEAEAAFAKSGNSRMAEEMRSGITGERRRPSSFVPPASRRLVARA